MKTDEQQTGKLWGELTNEQKDDLLLPFEESKNENNLIEAEKIFKFK